MPDESPKPYPARWPEPDFQPPSDGRPPLPPPGPLPEHSDVFPKNDSGTLIVFEVCPDLAYKPQRRR